MVINWIIWKEHVIETWKKVSKIKMSITWLKDIEYWKNYIKDIFWKSNETEIKRDLVALKDFKIKTKNWDFSLDWDDFKLHKVVEVSDYNNTLTVKDREYFTKENINFINSTFSNFFKNNK